jgi:hypothetical protein
MLRSKHWRVPTLVAGCASAGFVATLLWQSVQERTDEQRRASSILVPARALPPMPAAPPEPHAAISRYDGGHPAAGDAIAFDPLTDDATNEPEVVMYPAPPADSGASPFESDIELIEGEPAPPQY